MKSWHRDLLVARLQDAIDSLYHNATPHHPTELLGDSERVGKVYQAAFDEWARYEISYIEKDHLGLSAKEWAKQARLGFSHNERYFWLVQRITEFGELYTYGRGGRTLAPSKLIWQRGGRFSMLQISERDYNAAEMTDMCQVIEAFNTYVDNWNKKENLKDIWLNYVSDHCPGCEIPPTEKIWTEPLELMCDDCKELLKDDSAA